LHSIFACWVGAWNCWSFDGSHWKCGLFCARKNNCCRELVWKVRIHLVSVTWIYFLMNAVLISLLLYIGLPFRWLFFLFIQFLKCKWVCSIDFFMLLKSMNVNCTNKFYTTTFPIDFCYASCCLYAHVWLVIQIKMISDWRHVI